MQGRRFIRPGLAVLSLTGAWLSGCSSFTRFDFPPGVVGYDCGRGETTPGGRVSATAIPDYRGSYTSLTMRWESFRNLGGIPSAHAVWTRGPKANSPPGWLEVSYVLDQLPPIHTRIRLQLSSGEFKEQDFVEPKDWERRKRMEHRFRQGSSVFVRDPDFIEKFTQAEWFEISVVDPAGVSLAQVRFDLADVRDSLAVMRKMEEQVVADVADYQHRCHPQEHVPIEEII
jgi:hypothetical protein